VGITYAADTLYYYVMCVRGKYYYYCCYCNTRCRWTQSVRVGVEFHATLKHRIGTTLRRSSRKYDVSTLKNEIYIANTMCVCERRIYYLWRGGRRDETVYFTKRTHYRVRTSKFNKIRLSHNILLLRLRCSRHRSRRRRNSGRFTDFVWIFTSTLGPHRYCISNTIKTNIRNGRNAVYGYTERVWISEKYFRPV